MSKIAKFHILPNDYIVRVLRKYQHAVKIHFVSTGIVMACLLANSAIVALVPSTHGTAASVGGYTIAYFDPVVRNLLSVDVPLDDVMHTLAELARMPRLVLFTAEHVELMIRAWFNNLEFQSRMITIPLLPTPGSTQTHFISAPPPSPPPPEPTTIISIPSMVVFAARVIKPTIRLPANVERIVELIPPPPEPRQSKRRRTGGFTAVADWTGRFRLPPNKASDSD